MQVLFSYCPKECLDPEYRRQLVSGSAIDTHTFQLFQLWCEVTAFCIPCSDCLQILAELAGYQADILCLQEVDEKLFRYKPPVVCGVHHSLRIPLLQQACTSLHSYVDCYVC
jgi:hypothetical protein